MMLKYFVICDTRSSQLFVYKINKNISTLILIEVRYMHTANWMRNKEILTS